MAVLWRDTISALNVVGYWGRGDIISALEGYRSLIITEEDIQICGRVTITFGGYHQYCGGIRSVLWRMFSTVEGSNPLDFTSL